MHGVGRIERADAGIVQDGVMKAEDSPVVPVQRSRADELERGRMDVVQPQRRDREGEVGDAVVLQRAGPVAVAYALIEFGEQPGELSFAGLRFAKADASDDLLAARWRGA